MNSFMQKKAFLFLMASLMLTSCINEYPSDTIRTTTMFASEDAVVSRLNSNGNYGQIPDLHLLAQYQINPADDDDFLNNNRAFINFNWGGAFYRPIKKATLYLYFNDTSSYFKSHLGNSSFFIKRAMTSWNENSITWNNQPVASPANRVEVPKPSSYNSNLEIDVTQLVKDLEFSVEKGGFMLQLQEENVYYDDRNILMMASSEHQNSSKRPKIIIEYY